MTYILDERFAECTLVSLYSLLKARPERITVDVYCAGPLGPLEAGLAALAERFPGADVALRSNDAFDALAGGKGHITAATFGRLFLPAMVKGRTLYIDGDTIVRKDIGPLFEMDLAGAAIAACRVPRIWRSVLALRSGSGVLIKHQHRARIRELEAVEGIDAARYFNAGIVLYDTDRIRSLGLDEAMADWQAAAALPTLDQDYLNILFKDHVTLADPTWNSIWGNVQTDRAPFPPEERERYRGSRIDPAIVHFTGARKPWDSSRTRKDPAERKWQEEWLSLRAEAPIP